MILGMCLPLQEAYAIVRAVPLAIETGVGEFNSMIENTIATTKNSGAYLTPGTIYNYGLDAFPILKEDCRCAIKTSPRTARGH